MIQDCASSLDSEITLLFTISGRSCTLPGTLSYNCFLCFYLFEWSEDQLKWLGVEWWPAMSSDEWCQKLVKRLVGHYLNWLFVNSLHYSNWLEASVPVFFPIFPRLCLCFCLFVCLFYLNKIFHPLYNYEKYFICCCVQFTLSLDFSRLLFIN